MVFVRTGSFMHRKTHRRFHATQSGNIHPLREDLLKFSVVLASYSRLLRNCAQGRRQGCAALANFFFLTA